MLAISAGGTMYRSTLNLMSQSEPDWHRIKNLTLNDDNTLSQQVMSAVPTEDMHIATKSYIDIILNNFSDATIKYVDTAIKSIPVDGTTIKLNDQGQLTLALSNVSGVSF